MDRKPPGRQGKKIEANGCFGKLRMALQEQCTGVHHASLLPHGHGVQGLSHIRPQLDLNKCKCPTSPGHDVDLPKLCAIPGGEYAVAGEPEVKPAKRFSEDTADLGLAARVSISEGLM